MSKAVDVFADIRREFCRTSHARLMLYVTYCRFSAGCESVLKATRSPMWFGTLTEDAALSTERMSRLIPWLRDANQNEYQSHTVGP